MIITFTRQDVAALSDYLAEVSEIMKEIPGAKAPELPLIDKDVDFTTLVQMLDAPFNSAAVTFHENENGITIVLNQELFTRFFAIGVKYNAMIVEIALALYPVFRLFTKGMKAIQKDVESFTAWVTKS